MRQYLSVSGEFNGVYRACVRPKCDRCEVDLKYTPVTFREPFTPNGLPEQVSGRGPEVTRTKDEEQK